MKLSNNTKNQAGVKDDLFRHKWARWGLVKVERVSAFFYFGRNDIMCPFVCVQQLWQWQNNTIDFFEKAKIKSSGRRDARRGSVCAKRAVIGVKREWESLSLQNGDLSCYCWKQHIIFRIKHVIEAIPISRWAWRTSLPEVNQLSARES